MDDSAITAITDVLDLLNAFGVTAVLYIFLRMFIRGDVLPRVVYEQMTERLLAEICTRILNGVREMLEEWRKEQARPKKGVPGAT